MCSCFPFYFSTVWKSACRDMKHDRTRLNYGEYILLYFSRWPYCCIAVQMKGSLICKLYYRLIMCTLANDCFKIWNMEMLHCKVVKPRMYTVIKHGYHYNYHVNLTASCISNLILFLKCNLFSCVWKSAMLWRKCVSAESFFSKIAL